MVFSSWHGVCVDELWCWPSLGSKYIAGSNEGDALTLLFSADGVQSAPIVRARQLIFGLVAKWLKQP